MNRLTRLLTPRNSPTQLPLIQSPPPPPPPPQNPISITRQRPSPPATASATKAHIHCSSISFSSYSHITSLPRILFDITFSATQTTKLNSMDQSQPPLTDDYVHIEDPHLSPRTDSLTDSIVNVANELNLDDVVSVQAEGEERRIELPEELSRSVMKLTCESHPGGGTCDVYVVGTAHVSQESCREVQEVIRFLKPQVVFLELCSSRVAVLAPQNLKVPTAREMIEMWKKKQNLFGILYSWFLAKVASRLEVSPGAEFRVAFEEARKCEAKVILGDRPVQITLRRTWAKMPLWHKTKLLYSLLFQAFFLPNPEDLDKMLKEMDDVDMLTLVIQEMSKEFPTLMETLVHERDQYMSSTLLKFASEHSSVVAVVGKGHMQGIKKHWKQPVVMKDLLELPSPTAVSAGKVLMSLGTAVAGVALISGIYLLWKK